LADKEEGTLMASQARNHHRIPQCYLKGFTKSKGVAVLNGLIASHAHRQVYARDERFRYAFRPPRIRWGIDLLSDLVDAQQREGRRT
jgi:hypothetical protein